MTFDQNSGVAWKLALWISIFLLALAGCAGEDTPVGANPSGATLAPTNTTAPALPTSVTEAPADPTAEPVQSSPEATAGPGAPDGGPTLAASSTPIPLQPTPRPILLAALPDPSGYEWKLAGAGFVFPVSMAAAHDGSGRLFLVEKQGTISLLRDGQAVDEWFLDISDRVGSGSSEQGLLGLAFDPNYETNGRFYVNYTDHDGNTVISRFTVTSNPDVADPNSEQILLTQEQPYANHNGGQVEFGPDGFLYLGLGDGGSAGDPQNNGQSLDTLLGKILRIDVSGDAYTIPADNPFTSGQHRPEIWAYGLRNPWRFSFDMQTGDLYIADVGQNNWEEINVVPAGSPAGLNFGWRYREATHSYGGNPPAGVDLVDPVFEYDHSQGCSVTGGYVYRGSMPEWQGVYLFADYCSGNVWGLLRANDAWQGKILFTLSDLAISTFGQDEQGEVYLVSMDGRVFRLESK